MIDPAKNICWSYLNFQKNSKSYKIVFIICFSFHYTECGLNNLPIHGCQRKNIMALETSKYVFIVGIKIDDDIYLG